MGDKTTPCNLKLILYLFNKNVFIFIKFCAKNLTNSTNVPKIAFENGGSGFKTLACSSITNGFSMFYTLLFLEAHLNFSSLQTNISAP